MIVPLLAGAAKTLVVSMLSEKIVLNVLLLMLCEWASEKSTNTIDDKIVDQIREKLNADGKLYNDFHAYITKRLYYNNRGAIMIDK